MFKSFLIVVLLFVQSYLFAQNNFIQFVNPFIGTGGHGHTYPGATLPHGMVQLSPDTRLQGWDGCSGYHYSDSFIYGFSHTHLSGTGCSDFGDILLMPGNGVVSPNNAYYGSLFSHEDENAGPGYYKVKLLDDDIDVELTATERVGVHHYKFNNAGKKYVILDLKHRDEVIESSIKIEDSVTVSGIRRSKAWAENQYVYFVMKFSQPIRLSGIWQNDFVVKNVSLKEASGKNIKSFFRFSDSAPKDLYISVAISPVSVEGARNNLNKEIGNKKFNDIKNEAEDKWNHELSKIEVQSNDTNKLKIFYTALYHTAIVPNINMDVDGRYRGRDNVIHQANGFTYYSVFSLWDTYRAAHPLYAIIDKKRTLDYIKTFLAQYQQAQRLPVWELASCETDCMIGYHSIPVIVDAYFKGVKEFDKELALEAMLASANAKDFGLASYQSNGAILSNDESESVSKTLEYAYDDYCIALFANAIGHKDVYHQFLKRSLYYQNILDTATGFMRPRKNGDWLTPFDPREVNNHFTEANSWQYSFYFPQDVNGYIKLMGGRQKLENKLDGLFNESIVTTGRTQSDITGLIGQYAHGNEPSHHIAYLYNYTDHPYKAQFFVNRIMNEFYKNTPEGLIGNEDCGQMSAWYILSSLGFYSVTPGTDKYLIGSPQFSNATIHLENGNNILINAMDAGTDHFYIQSAFLKNGKKGSFKKRSKPFWSFSDLQNGGIIQYNMGKNPANNFKESIKDKPIAELQYPSLMLNPIIHGAGVAFRGSKTISISYPKHSKLYYTLDGSNPTVNSKIYKRPLTVDTSVIIKAIAIDKMRNQSFVTSATYKKIKNDWDLHLRSNFLKQYDGGGDDALIDGVIGSTNWRTGEWQGYQVDNFDVVIDLRKFQAVSKIAIRFLQDVKSWIVAPQSVIFELSNDGVDFKEVFRSNDIASIESLKTQILTVGTQLKNQSARYIRIKAEQYGKLPVWHSGVGGDSIIFVDEIEVQ